MSFPNFLLHGIYASLTMWVTFTCLLLVVLLTIIIILQPSLKRLYLINSTFSNCNNSTRYQPAVFSLHMLSRLYASDDSFTKLDLNEDIIIIIIRVFHWRLSDRKFPRVSRTLLSILAVFNNAVVWMVSTRPPTSKFSRPFNNPLVTVPKAPITIAIIVTFIFNSFFNSLARSRYLSLFIFLHASFSPKR